MPGLSRIGYLDLALLLAIPFGLSAPGLVHAAPPPAVSALAPASSGQTPSDQAPPDQAPPDRAGTAANPAGVGLQLLDPDTAAGDTEDGFLADFRRWIDIFFGDYQTFLPLIAMFVAIGAAALVYFIRRRLTLNRLDARSKFMRTGAARRLREPETVTVEPAPPRR